MIINTVTPPELKPSYLAGLDGLRALAVALVVIFHFFPTILPFGYLGVDIFFVLSGFLVGNIIIKDIGKPNFFINFYSARIKRIFPPLILLILINIIIGFFIFDSHQIRMLREEIYYSSLFIKNFFIGNLRGYFGDNTNEFPLLHLWSLAIEEQFYIIMPLIMFWVSKNKKLMINTLVIISSISLLSMCIGQLLFQQETFFNSFFRFWELSTGVFLAAKQDKIKDVMKQLNAKTFNYFIIVILSFLTLTNVYFEVGNVFQNIFIVIFTFLIIGNCLEEKNKFFVIDQKPLVFLGKISYSLY
ncbi:acyltransferase, partial [Alphaproteobacteria bacterium]|nr:acyltransferase [Alphaproteobacteria bacterium]